MNLKKKSFLTGAAVVTIGTLVAGCGTGGNNTTSSGSGGGNTTTNTTGGTVKTPDYSKASGTIVWAAPPITHTGLRAKLIKEFEAKYPNVKVTLQNQNNNTDTNKASLTTAIQGGSSKPDVYMGDVVWPAQMASHSMAVPLDTKLPKSFWNRFASGLVKGATYKGHVYAAPFFVDSGFLFYRKDLLKKAGIANPPTTWAELKADAQKVQKKGLVQYGYVWQGASYEGTTCDFTEFLADAGGKVLNSSGKPVIDSPQAQKALTFMTGLIKSGVSPKAEDTFHEKESMNVFDQGNALFLRNWSYAWSNSQTSKNSKVVGKVGVTVLPTFKGNSKHYSTIGGWDLYVNPHSKNMLADLAFINWMTGKGGQDILAKDYSELPTNASVQNDPAVKKVSPVFTIVNKTSFVSRPSQNPNYAAISQAIYQNVNKALSGGTTPAAALKKAQSQIKSALSGGL
ncbi:ABC transporter substrate-binding protein [Alicyclobacillus sp. SO9]|uniref:ABC transporter substrate-binding protein n=1 Tax=Alicyclobacillus sp. SO9 TaxID=2665646 RepID=UPI0018E72D82|nr:ABC transporter substrate-binding protein [Alicyclobacillus sp. SO9]QQE79436.1 ABC transporter substrate-binding protein [Alicyclobacillus sp. SO9]